jgi:hypothetical protein
MTGTLGYPDRLERLRAGMQGILTFLANAAFGLFVAAAAVLTLLAAAFIGLMLALAAVFLRFSRPRRRTSGDGAPLEARRSGDGWVVEL